MSAQHVMRRSIAVLAVVIPALAWSNALHAQVGYLSARAHLSGDRPASRFPSHTYFASGDSLVDRPDGAFPAGHYTIARLEVDVPGCIAVATNVPFTITAGQLTDIDPLVTLQSCRLRAAPESDFGGVGRVQLIPSVSATAGLDCNLSKINGIVVVDPPSACSLTLPYGEAFTLKLTLGDDKTHIPDIQYTQCTLESNHTTYDCPYAADSNHTGIVGDENFNAFTGDYGSPEIADASIALIGTTQSGLGTISRFRITNAGPHIYFGEVRVLFSEEWPHNGINVPSYADGACITGCEIRLGAGYSADFEVRSVPLFDRQLNGDPIVPSDSRYCERVKLFAVSEGLHLGSADPDTTNNSAPCVSGDVQTTVTAGTSTPPDQTVTAGSSNVPLVQFALNPSSPTTLDNITLTASGTGNEVVDVTAVKLFVDKNANGAVDAGDTQLASGTYGSNNGTVTLSVAPPYAVSAPTSFLVTYDFNTTLASRYGGAIVLAGLLPLFFVPRKRRRGAAGLLLLLGAFAITSIGLGACGGDSTGPNPPPGGSVTFSAQLSGVTAGGTAVSGVAVSGATLTVAR